LAEISRLRDAHLEPWIAEHDIDGPREAVRLAIWGRRRRQGDACRDCSNPNPCDLKALEAAR